MTINVEPTAEVIDSMADRLELEAESLQRISKNMRERNDLSYAAEAVGLVANLMAQLRLDLLVTRPVRELR